MAVQLPMPILLVFLVVFVVLLQRQPAARAYLVLFSLGTYLILIFAEQVYLEHFFGLSFHPSDPSNYFNTISNLSSDALMEFLRDEDHSSNKFYYLVNWLFHAGLRDASATALMLKVTNAVVFLSGYMLLPRASDRVDYIDYLLLFHPYLLDMLIRNVRDAYIVFFLVLYVVSLQAIVLDRSRMKNGLLALGSVGFMFAIRPFFSFLMLLMAAADRARRWQPMTRAIVVMSAVAVTLIVSTTDSFGIKTRLLSAVFSAMTVHEGVDPEREAVFADMLSGAALNGALLVEYLKRVAIGFPVFLFTPHPVDYALRAAAESHNGIWNIYTTFDNVLITVGAGINYLIVFPLLLKALHRASHVPPNFRLIVLFMLAVYAIFQLGITDVRIKYCFLFFVLAGLRLGGLHILMMRRDWPYFGGAAALFVGALVM